MAAFVLILLLLAACFGGVILAGAPYVPTLTPQVKAALELADLQPGQTLLELGCGDGRVLIAAAQQGINSIGYELNPLMAAIAWLRTRRYRRQVKIVWGDFWGVEWPEADAVFVFLLGRFMPRLDGRLNVYVHKPIKLASFAFEIPGKRAASKKAGVFLYKYN
jgi:SAM-dependent methyltransferase